MPRIVRALSLFAAGLALALVATAATPDRAVAQSCSGSLQSISPCTGSATLPPSTPSGPLTYTITNNNNTDAATYSISCSSSYASCSASSPLTIPAHSSRNFTVNYTTGSTGGAGPITITALGGDDDLAATIDLVVNTVQVTPKALVVQDYDTMTYHQPFTVKNLSTVTATISLAKVCDSGVTNCTGPTHSSFTLGAGATGTDTIHYKSKSEGVSGWVRLIGTDNAHTTSVDTGSINVTVPSPLPPTLTLTPHNGENRAVGLCALACFDVIAAYSTPAYTSYDTPRAATIFYSSAQAAPVGEVQLDVTDPSFRKADVMSLELKRPNGSAVTFTNGTTKLYFNQTIAGALTRVSGQFDASGDSSGVYPYTAIVTLSWTGPGSDHGITTSTSVAVNVLELNQRGSALGAGWSLAGAQRLLFSSDSLTIGLIDGAGSIARFTRSTKTAVAFPSAADFSSIVTNKSGSTVTGYTRTLPDGTALRYGVTGFLLAVRNRFNDSTRFHYDGSNRVDSIIDPAGKAIRLAYVSGKLSTITDPGGRVSTFTINGTSGDLTSIADPMGIATFAGTYDGSHRLTQRTDRAGKTWLYRYDFAGKLASDSTPAVWADSVTQRIGTRYHSLESTVLIDPGSGTGSSASPASQKLTANLRTSAVSPSGDSALSALDKFGAVTLVEAPSMKDTTWLTRNANSQVTRTLEHRRGKTVVNATAFWSSNYAQLLGTTDSLTGATIAYAYDNTYSMLTDVTGNTTNRKFFLNSAKTWVDSTCIRSAGVCTDTTRVHFWYDAHGRDTLTVDAQKDSTKSAFDVAGTAFRNLLTVRTGNRITTYKYDGYGRATWIKNPRGDSAMLSLDSLNRTRNVKGAQGSIVSFAYDSVALKSITDAKGQVYTYYRNALGWLDSLKNANTSDTPHLWDKYEYTKLGALKAHVNRRGQRVSMTYDAQGRLATRTIAPGQTSTFAYDDAGLWASSSNAEASDTVRSDTTGLTQVEVTVRGSHLSSVTAVADYTGLVRSFTFSSDATNGGTSLTYGYDNNRRLDSIVVGGALTSFLYNSDGMLTKTILPTLPTKDTITYAVSGAHASYSVTHSNTTLNAAFGAYYTRDALDRVVQRARIFPDTSWTYTYDSLGRIAQYQILKDTSALSCVPDPNGMDGMHCTSPHGEQVIGQSTFTYDSVGNPTDLGAVVIPGNRLTTYNGFTLTYDYDGNLTHKQKSGFDQYFWWNSIGQLDSVRTNSDTVRFGYDASGRRVRKTVGKAGSHYTLRYFYSGPQVIAEVDSATNTALRVYTYYGLDAPHTMKYGGKTYYYLQELGAGHVVGLVSGDSTKIKNRYRYQPFGQLEDSLENITNPQRFTGREYDAETQLYYYRARYYDVASARFISEDPAGLSGSINGYQYTSGDPVNRNDPGGLADEAASMWNGGCPTGWIPMTDTGHCAGGGWTTTSLGNATGCAGWGCGTAANATMWLVGLGVPLSKISDPLGLAAGCVAFNNFVPDGCRRVENAIKLLSKTEGNAASLCRAMGSAAQYQFGNGLLLPHAAAGDTLGLTLGRAVRLRGNIDIWLSNPTVYLMPGAFTEMYRASLDLGLEFIIGHEEAHVFGFANDDVADAMARVCVDDQVPPK